MRHHGVLVLSHLQRKGGRAKNKQIHQGGMEGEALVVNEMDRVKNIRSFVVVSKKTAE